MLDLTGYKLTFSDEFNARSISQTGNGTTWADIRSKWRFDANSDIGFGQSSFVDPASGYDPFSVKGGTLSITAVPDRTPFGYKGSWESGLITTQGGFSQTYGYFEMRANLADKPGAWDAFWLLPDKPAPNPGNLPGWQELDVVEHLGSNNQGTYRWIHTTDPGPNKNPNLDLQVYSNNPSQVSGFHTYGMNWQKDTISFYFDGQLMGSRPTPSDMHGPMYLLADLAIKGSSANNADAPITMEIDYIRAYSNAPDAVAATQGIVSAPDNADPGLYGASNAGSSSVGFGADKLVAVIDIQSQPQNRPYFGSVTHDVHSAAGEVYALYDALLGRPADALGLAAWTNAVGHGLLVKDIAQQFLDSSEGQARAGALDSASFVEQLYAAALHRHPDAVGLQSWTNFLAQGGSRADVALGFSLSPEHLGNLQTTFNAGVFVADTSAAMAARLYYGILDRAPDAAGLSAWTSAIEKGAPVAAVAQQFLTSPEAQLKFAGADDARFVTGLYENALGRTADAGGLQYWLGALQHGSSRAEVASLVSESYEAQIHLVGQIETGWHLT